MLEAGTIRNTDQTDARLDQEPGSLQTEYGNQAMKGMPGQDGESTDRTDKKPGRE